MTMAAAYRRMPADARLTMTVTEFLELAEEVARERGGVARWIRTAAAAELAKVPTSTLRRQATGWALRMAEGKPVPVRVTKMSDAEKSDWLFDEDDCRAYGAAREPARKAVPDTVPVDEEAALLASLEARLS